MYLFFEFIMKYLKKALIGYLKRFFIKKNHSDFLGLDLLLINSFVHLFQSAKNSLT